MRTIRPPLRLRARITRVVVGLLLASGVMTAVAQRPPWGRGGWQPAALHEGLPPDYGGFLFCRLIYTQVRREPGGQGWSTDYPGSDRNFMIRLSQFTNTRIGRWSEEEPGFVVVRATDPNLFRCPFLFASDVGTMALDAQEVQQLRQYLLKGGFLWVDDFWGDRAWEQWQATIRAVLPDYPIAEIAPDHPMLSIFYQIDEVPQIPSIQFWRGSGGLTSERGAESAVPRLRAITDETGRILVLMSHNTDIADGWEREGEDFRFLDAFSPNAYAVGVNVALWAMTH